jgi:HEAT repeat protein
MPFPHQPVGATRRAIVTTTLLLVIAVVPTTRVDAADAAPSATAAQAAKRVLAALDADDPDLRAVALERVRHGLHGRWFTEAVVAKLSATDPGRQIEILMALAHRGDAAAVPEASRLMTSAGDAGVRVAGVRLVGRLGGGGDVPALVAALAADGPVPAAARRALVELSGPGAAAALHAAAAAGSVESRATVLDVLAERRDRAAVPIFVAAARGGDAAVRQAAIRGLAAYGGPGEIPAMAASLLGSTGDERKATEAAITRVCTSGREAAAATDAVVSSYEAADEAGRTSLLPVLARIGGPKVMSIVDATLADPARRAQGLDALAKWPDATVKDRLLDLLGTATSPEERELLLSALIRIAPLPDNKLNDAEKLDLLVKTMALCERNDDRARVLERANAIRTIDTFRFVVPYLDDPAVAESACRSTVELAHHQKLRDAHKAEFTSALDKVLAITKNPELGERAARYKAGQTWDRGKKN